MISLTRLNGERIAVNPDLIERAEATPDTVLTLTNGTKYVVSESLDELSERIQYFRAATLAIARDMSPDPEASARFRLHLVRDDPLPAPGDDLEPEELPHDNEPPEAVSGDDRHRGFAR